jgi:hypothetical protein
MVDSEPTVRRSGHSAFTLRTTARPPRHGRAIAKPQREDPGAAHARQQKLALETEGTTEFGGDRSNAQVGRVSPRPQDRGRSDPAVSERPPYLPARSTDRDLMLARVRSGPAAAGSRGPEI